jgi:DNA-binding SARP family transcriptional activator
LNHPKVQALLYYLAATGEVFTRNHLATLLWSETGASEALHSLRSSLYRLRQGLRSAGAEATLLSEGESLSLNPDSFLCDLGEFRRLLDQADELALAKAVTTGYK